MIKASKAKQNGTRVTIIGQYNEVGIGYEMDDGTIYKTAGSWAEETNPKKVIHDDGETYRNEIDFTNAPATLKT